MQFIGGFGEFVAAADAYVEVERQFPEKRPKQASADATPVVAWSVVYAHSLHPQYGVVVADSADKDDRGQVPGSKSGVKAPVAGMAANDRKKDGQGECTGKMAAKHRLNIAKKSPELHFRHFYSYIV